YCTGLSDYKNKRSIQQSCILTARESNDTNEIKKCMNYIIVAYYDLPLGLTAERIYNYSTIPNEILLIDFSVFNSNNLSIQLTSISYSVTKGGNKLASDVVKGTELNSTLCLTCSYIIPPRTSREVSGSVFIPSMVWNSSTPIGLSGMYTYRDNGSKLISKH